jgi:hypothetical protein
VTKYFHPHSAYRKIDWDAALVGAIPKVRAAMTTEEFLNAMQGMLATLGDPATKLYRISQAEE